MNIYMKKLASFLLISTLAAAAWAQPKPVFLGTYHNFGAFPEDNGLAVCRFSVVNEGSSPLVIMSARATCGCTNPEYPRKPIAPGDTAYITVAYNPAGRPGRFNKSVYIETNAQPAKYKLDIAGTVIGSDESIRQRYPADLGPLRLAKTVFPLGDAIMGRLKTVYFEGYNRSADSLRIALKDVPSYVDIVVAPEVVPPGEQATLIAYISPSKGAQYGVNEDTITIIPAPGLSYELPLLLNVAEDFSKLDAAAMEKAPIAVPSSDRIELGPVSHSGAPIKASMKLSNAGKSDLKIRRVYSVDKGVEAKVSASSIKKDKSATIDILVDPAAQEGGLLNARLQIITNDPLQPVHTVRIVGEWAD